jgi:hypothetical protein
MIRDSGELGLDTMVRAHRAAWILANGPVPEGLIVRHKCDNPLCVNVGHLELGTFKDNTNDMISRGRMMTAKRREGDRNRKCSICRDLGHRRNRCPKAQTA